MDCAPLESDERRESLHPDPFPLDMVLTPVSRWPTQLPPETVRAVLSARLPEVSRMNPGPPETEPRASVIVVTHDNLVFTRLCIGAILAYTGGSSYELLVIDNGSTDETPEFLQALAREHPHVRVVLNGENRGFAAANNQGIRLSRGQAVVLLNNDTLVCPGWLPRLIRHLEDREIGMVGPVTNRTCNEAQIEARYKTFGEFLSFVRDREEKASASPFDIRMLAMYCSAFRRETYERVGGLDERYEIGMFEDDDYALRMRGAGYRVACAPDVFIHHFGQVSFGVIEQDFNDVFHANKKRFEEKWGIRWEPHHRDTPEYLSLVGEIKERVGRAVPPDSRLLVVSKGDDKLLGLGGVAASHFPQDDQGAYTGYYPEDGEEAIRLIEDLKVKGYDFILFPRISIWWLDHYKGLKDHLEGGRAAVFEDEVCRIYRLHMLDAVGT